MIVLRKIIEESRNGIAAVLPLIPWRDASGRFQILENCIKDLQEQHPPPGSGYFFETQTLKKNPEDSISRKLSVEMERDETERRLKTLREQMKTKEFFIESSFAYLDNESEIGKR